MFPNKRGRYQVFRADKSIPTSKVSLWRMQHETENVTPSEDIDNRTVQCETSTGDPGVFIDAFHDKSFKQVSFCYNLIFIDNLFLPNEVLCFQ